MNQLVEDLIFAAIIIVSMTVAGFGAYHFGRVSAQHEAELQRQATNVEATDRFNKAQRDAREREFDLQQQLTQRDAALDTERATHAKDVDTLRASVRAGAVRLSVPVARCEVPASNAADNPAVVAAPGSEARADLVPGIADAIFRLAGQSADDVRDYNEVIERYEACRTFSTLR